MNDDREGDESSLFMEGPIPLIEVSGQEIKLNEKALNMIRSIREEVIIVSITGKEKSGKSYLMNLIMNDLPIGFKLSTLNEKKVNSLQIWGNFRPSKRSKCKILFIDTDITSKRDSQTNPKLLMLIYLISSVLIHNTNSFIDDNAVNELALFQEIPNYINVSVWSRLN